MLSAMLQFTPNKGNMRNLAYLVGLNGRKFNSSHKNNKK